MKKCIFILAGMLFLGKVAARADLATITFPAEVTFVDAPAGVLDSSVFAGAPALVTVTVDPDQAQEFSLPGGGPQAVFLFDVPDAGLSVTVGNYSFDIEEGLANFYIVQASFPGVSFLKVTNFPGGHIEGVLPYPPDGDGYLIGTSIVHPDFLLMDGIFSLRLDGPGGLIEDPFVLKTALPNLSQWFFGGAEMYGLTAEGESVRIGLEIVLTPTPISIDIKPGSSRNSVRNDGNGVIPVAVLGSSSFDVTQVDPSTIMLENMRIRTAGQGKKPLAHLQDTNGDGFTDLVVQIEDIKGALEPGSTSATLTGNLLPEFGGTPFSGVDGISLVPR